MDSRKNNLPDPNNNDKDQNNKSVEQKISKLNLSFDQLPDNDQELEDIVAQQENSFVAFSTDPEIQSAQLSSDGLYISATFNTASTPMLPAIGASNFVVKVNNVPMPVTFGTRDSSVNTKFIINLPEPIIHSTNTGYGITNVTLSYIGGNVRNNLGVGLSSFSDHTVVVSSTDFPVSYFDPLDWVLGGYTSSIPNGDLFERRSGSNAGIILYDAGTGITTGGIGNTVGFTSSIYGQTVINYLPSNGGMNIHYFGCYATNNDSETSADILGGSYYIQDILENTIRQATEFGGKDIPDQYDTIGDGNGYSAINILNKVSNDYPVVKSIEFCITATSPKNYVIEAKKTPSDDWTELLYMYASSRTKEYFRYVFSSNSLKLYAVRIRYRGEYFYQDNSGKVTVAAKDTVSGLKALQISHYPDFSDAENFSTSFPAGVNLGDGWIKFTDGISEYDWNIVDTTSIWTQFAGLGLTSSQLKYFKNSLIATTSAIGNTSYIYSINSSGVGTTVYSVATTINDLAIHDNKLYVALNSGKVLRTTTGITYSDLITNLPPVKSLLSFSNKLWIGTGTSGLDYPDGKVYSYVASNNTLSLSRTFTSASVNSFGKSTKYLFTGLSGTLKGQIYHTDGNTWTQTLDTLENSVDTIEYNGGSSQVWAGDSSGAVYSISFNNDNTIKTSSRIYDQFTDKYYNFTNGADNNIFWLISSSATSGVIAYVPSLSAFRSVNQPSGTSIKGISYWGSSAYGIALNGNIYSVNQSTLLTNDRKVYVRFKNKANNISNTAVIDNIIFGTASLGTSSQEAVGKIHQITPNVTPSGSTVVTYTTNNTPVSALFAPNRKTRESGIYESEPFYSDTLTRWDEITTVANYPAGSIGGSGLEAGTQIKLYIRSANNRTDLLDKEWGEPFTYSTINTGDPTGNQTNTYSLAAYNGNWIQYKAELTTATASVTPYLDSVTLNYYASEATYFYTKLFDTASQLNSDPAPLIRRALLTYNGMANGGVISFKYSTDPDENSAYQLSNYTDITPNTVFTLSEPSQYIRIAALLISADVDPAVIDEIGLQIETATDDLYWMKYDSLSGISLDNTTVSGGGSVTGRVTITGPAPVAGVEINLTSNNVHASVPSSVTITSGNSVINFTVTTTSVTESTSVSITASLNDGALSTSLTIT